MVINDSILKLNEGWIEMWWQLSIVSSLEFERLLLKHWTWYWEAVMVLSSA